MAAFYDALLYVFFSISFNPKTQNPTLIQCTSNTNFNIVARKNLFNMRKYCATIHVILCICLSLNKNKVLLNKALTRANFAIVDYEHQLEILRSHFFSCTSSASSFCV